MRRLAVALACASLAACAGFGTLTPPNTSPGVQGVADGVVIRGTQALIVANLTYQSLGTPIAVAMEQGVITGALKDRLKEMDRQVIALLRAGAATQDVAEKGRKGAAALSLLVEMARSAGVPLPQF